MTTQAPFPAASRLLHWLMAPMIVTMLFIGVGMAASVSARYELWSRSTGRLESPSLYCS